METDTTFPAMDDAKFWDLIALAGKNFNVFHDQLAALDREALTAFVWKFEYLAGLLDDEQYHHNQHSEDYLEDLNAWVVARGRRHYEAVRTHPNTMPTEVNYDEPGLDVRFEAQRIFLARYGEHMPAFDGG